MGNYLFQTDLNCFEYPARLYNKDVCEMNVIDIWYMSYKNVQSTHLFKAHNCFKYRWLVSTLEIYFCLDRYASMWKGCLTLYTGRGGDLQKIGEWVLNIDSHSIYSYSIFTLIYQHLAITMVIRACVTVWNVLAHEFVNRFMNSVF